MGLKNFTDNKVRKSIVQITYFLYFLLNPRNNHSFQGPTLAAIRPFASLETKRELGRVNYFAKACWTVTWDREKNWPIADRRVPRKPFRDKSRIQFPSRWTKVANCIYFGGFSCIVSVIASLKTDKRAEETHEKQREEIVGNTGNQCKDTPRYL